MSDCNPNINRFFGPVQTHIKLYNGTFVAVEGPNMTHKMSNMPYIKIPYQQVITSRITLRAGQTNYLLNHLGLGDNVTFLSINAQYDDKSKFESDNYVQYSYYSDRGRIYSFAQMLVLTGNSENRIEQLYLHNPNQNTNVILEVMVAIIDDYYNFFEENDNAVVKSSAYTIENIKSDDIAIWDDSDEVMIVRNELRQVLLYLNLPEINSISREGAILTIDDRSVGTILLVFINEYEASLALVKINDWRDNFVNGVSNTPLDDFEPVIYFTDKVIDNEVVAAYGSYLTSLDGDGLFVGSNTISLATYNGTISKLNLIDLLIQRVEDYESDLIAIGSSNLLLRTDSNVLITEIVSPGEYYIFFDITDSIGNKVNSGVSIKINIVV